MNERNPNCPKCQGPLTLLEGGLRYCSKCGFEGEVPKADPKTLARKNSADTFWTLLLAPAALGLCSLLMDSAGAGDIGVAIGVLGLPFAVAGSIYCSIWIVRHYSPPGSAHILRLFLLMFGLGTVNLGIVFAGCALSRHH